MRKSLKGLFCGPATAANESWMLNFLYSTNRGLPSRRMGSAKSQRIRNWATNLVDYQALEARQLLVGGTFATIEFDLNSPAALEDGTYTTSPTISIQGDLSGLVNPADRTITFTTPTGSGITAGDVTVSSFTFDQAAYPTATPIDVSASIVVQNDSLVESNEIFDVSIDVFDPMYFALGVNASVSTSITDNDTATWSFTQDNTVIDEGESAIFTFSLSGTLQDNETATIDIERTFGGVTMGDFDFAVTLSNAISNAVADFNFGIASGDELAWDGTTLTYTAGDDGSGGSAMTDVDISVDTFDDAGSFQTGHLANLVEPDESFNVTISDPGGTVSMVDTSGLLSLGTQVMDDDSAVVAISSFQDADEQTLADGILTVTLSNPSQTDTIVNFTDGGATMGTASSGFDYNALAGNTLNFSTGETTKFLTIDTIDDILVEGPETVTLQLTSFGGHDDDITIDGLHRTSSITIVDNEIATWSLTGDTAVAEGATASYTLALTGKFQTTVDAKVDLAISFPADATSLDAADTADFVNTLLADIDTSIATYNSGGNSGTFARTGNTLTYTHGNPNSFVDALTINLGVSEDAPAANNLVEGSEDFTLTISNPNSGTGADIELHPIDVSVTTTITDGDTATWSLDGSGTVAEGSSASYTLALDSTMQAGEVAKVNLAISFPNDAANMDAASAADFVNEFLADINTSIASFSGTSGAYAAAVDGEFITITYTHGLTDGPVDLLSIDLATSGENVATNDLIEGPEDFTLTISEATTPSTTGATVAIDGMSDAVTTAITDGDNATWSIIGSNAVNEGADATYTISLDGVLASGEEATTNVGLTGVDTTSADHADFVTAVGAAAMAYSGSGTVVFDGTNKLTFTASVDGDTMDDLIITLGASDDSLVEGVEDFDVSIDAPGSSTDATVVIDGMGGTVTTTITDNDTAKWSLTDDNDTANMVGESETALFLLNLSGLIQAGETASVDLAISFPEAGTSMDAAEGADFNNSFLSDVASAVDVYNMADNSGTFTLVDNTLTYTQGAIDGAVDSLAINLDTGSDSIVEGTEDFTQTLTASASPSSTGADIEVSTETFTTTTTITDADSAIWSLKPSTTIATEYQSTDVPLHIFDEYTFTSELEISEEGEIFDVNVMIDITHTYVGDLDVWLTSPAGTTIHLFQNVGGGGENFENTILDDEADGDIEEGSAPFAGSYAPFEPLSEFDGESMTGTWVLEITDDYLEDEGTLNAWSLMIDVGEFAETVDEGATTSFDLALSGFLQAGETASTDLAVSFPAMGVSLDAGDADDFANGILVDVAAAIDDYNSDENSGTFALMGSTLTYTHGPTDGAVNTLPFSLTTDDDELVEGSEDFSLTLLNSMEPSTTGADVLISESDYTTTTTIIDDDVATWWFVDDNETANQVDEGEFASYLLGLDGNFEAGETATVNLAVSYPAAGISMDDAETVDFSNTLLSDLANAITVYNGESNSGTYSLAGSTLTYTHGAVNGSVDDLRLDRGISTDNAAANNLVEGDEDFALTIGTAGSTSGADIEISGTEYTTTTTIHDLDSATWSLTDNNVNANHVSENATASLLLNLDGRLQAGETASVDLAISYPAAGISMDAAESADFVDPFLSAVAAAADAYNLAEKSGTFVLVGSTLTYTQSATDSAVDSLEILLDTGSDSMVEGPEDFTQTITESAVSSDTGANIRISDDQHATTTTITDTDSATWTLVDNNLVADQVEEGSTASYLLTLDGFLQAGETTSVDLAISFPNDGDSLDAAEEADFISSFLDDVDAAIELYNGGGEGFTSAGTFARAGNTLTYTQGVADGSPASLHINRDISEGVSLVGNLVEGPEDYALTLTATAEPSTTGADVLLSESQFTTTTTIVDSDVATWKLTDHNSVANQVNESATASYLLSLEGALQAGETATVDLAISFPNDGPSMDAAEAADFTSGLLADVATAITAYNLDENSGTFSLSGSTLTYTHGESDGFVDNLQLDLGISNDNAANNNLVEGGEEFALTISAAASTTGAAIEVDAIEYTTTTTIVDADVATWSIADNNTLANTVGEGTTASYLLSLAGTLQAGETASVDLDISFPTTAPSLDAAEEADFTNSLLTDLDSAIATYNAGGHGGTFTRSGNTLTYTHGASDGTVTDLQINLGVNEDNVATDNLVEGSEDFTLTIGVAASTTGAEVEINHTADATTTTITDNDLATWSILDSNTAANEINEGATASYLLRLEGFFQAGEVASTNLAISFPISGTDGSAADFVDTMLAHVDLAVTDYNTGGNSGSFARSGNTLTYTHGPTDGTVDDLQIDLVSKNDSLVESFEQFTLTISAAGSTSGANIAIDASDDAVTTTIKDNDNTDWSFSQSGSIVNEGDSAVYTLTLSGLIQQNETATIDFSWTLLDVTSLSDFSETLSHAITTAVGDYNAAATDGDSLAWDGTTLSYTGGDDASGGTMMAPLIIDINTFDDFETSQAGHLANLVEPDEEFDVTISNQGGSVSSQILTTDPTTLRKTIQDDDSAVVTIIDIQTGGENPIGFGTDGLFEFRLSNPSQTETFVNFTDGGFSAGTAEPGFDYVGILSSGLNFSAGETSKILSVDPVDDQSVEGPETVTIRLTGFTTHDPQITIANSPDNQATTQITDNDNTELTVGDAVINEATGTASISVTLGKAVQGGFTVPYTLGDVSDTATGGTDYDNTGGTLVFAGTAGEVKMITIPVMNEDLVENGEFMTAKLGTPVPNTVTLPAALINATDTGQVTIEDNDAATLTVTGFSIDESVGTATVTVTVDNAVQGGFTVDLAVGGDSASNGTDFTGNGGTLTFSGTVGESQFFEFEITNDEIVEIDETINLTLANVAAENAPAESIDSSDTAVVTIEDDDTATLTVADIDFVENSNVATVTVAVDNAVDGGFNVDFATLDGTATSGVDYTPTSGTLIFVGNAGETQTFEVAVNEDILIETDETLNIVLSNLVANKVDEADLDASDSAIVTIYDDELQSQVGESGSVAGVTSDWQTIDLILTYDNPVVIAGPATYEGVNPAVVRVRNVTANSFEIRIDEWDYLDEMHGPETVDFLVLEAGTHRLPDGSVVTAGNQKITSNWSRIPTGSDGTIVLTTVITDNDSATVIPRINNVGTSFLAKLQEEEGADRVHGVETISWIQFGEGSGNFNATQFVTGQAPVTHAQTAITFEDSFDSPPVFLAGIQTLHGGDPISIRRISVDGSQAVVFLEEETSFDTEIYHTAESVGFLALDAGIIQAVAANDGQLGETGVADLNHVWTQINFSQPYVNPVVVLGTASTIGEQAVTTRVRSVTSTGFEARIQEWAYLDGGHVSESVAYMVMEAGVHVLEDGTTVTAGTLPAVTQAFQRIKFPIIFDSAPVVFSQVNSDNDTAPIVTRQGNVSTTSVDLRLQEEEAGFEHDAEVVGWIAFEQSVGINNSLLFETGTTGTAVTQENFDLSFVQTFNSLPAFFAQLQSYNGGDPVSVRYRQLDLDGSQVFLQEERSLDSELGHGAEDIGYLAFEIGSIFAKNREPLGRIASNGSGNIPDETILFAQWPLPFVRLMPEVSTYTMTANRSLSADTEAFQLAGSIELTDNQSDAAFAELAETDIAFDADFLDSLTDVLKSDA